MLYFDKKELMDDLKLVEKAVRAGNHDDSMVSHIERSRPYGLNFSSLYHSIHADQSIGLRGHNILELGGALPAQWVFEHIGASTWTAIENEVYEQLIPGGNQYPHTFESRMDKSLYSYHAKGIQDYIDQSNAKFTLADKKTEKLFDRVYSVAAFEHIDNLAAALDACSQICQSGALLYSYFTPVWCAPFGHHLGAIKDKFPLPYWHLLNTPQSAFRKFLMSGSSVIESQAYVNDIYKNPHINRLTTYDYDIIFKLSPWKVLRKQPINYVSIGDMAPEFSGPIKAIYPNLSYLCDGYWLILRLP